MTEEEKKEQEPEAKEEQAPKKEETAQKAEKEQEKESEAPKPSVSKEGRTKVTKMTLAQVNEEIEETLKHMGGLHSRYGRSLKQRKDFLLQYEREAQRKAA